ncbi:Aerotaxis receptor [Vibrio scophthalmi]|uniref:methyl-accepting chemotaxis protein n=1 Tax=Vibrio scophthalmi TaxID=45658 RepID=UPI0008091B64|nr:PAS domain-containing methyl-accepting chemotaxis protein [Vibrio scophthalmi]ANS87320.1 Aerotaxis receptor [Vibrio scophthalmi]
MTTTKAILTSQNDEHLNKQYSHSVNLISTTDTASNITYANHDFCDIAGYQEQQLLGYPHNIVRHNDMPKAAFEQMWGYLQSGKSWMGLVKNQCRDEQHYWVSAFVTPIKDADGHIVEYQSVRSKPAAEQISRASALYKKLREGKTPHLVRLDFHSLSISLCTLLVFIAFAHAILQPHWQAFLLLILSTIMLGGLSYQYKRFRRVQTLTQDAYNNPMMEKIYTDKFDDYSQVELALMMRKAELRAITGRATETSGHILISAEDEFGTIQSIGHSLDQQCAETEQVATAVEELTQSIAEVSNAASAASMIAEDANEHSSNGLISIESTINEVNMLVSELNQSQTIINQLAQDTQKIDGILEVITAISEQTNLLALNAAIEAARAGEAGRGFAVVADEVRNLASKTGSSANEIHSMIRHLQATAGNAVSAMDKGLELSERCKTRADETGDMLRNISTQLDNVSDTSHQIAAAVEQQASVTQEINRNIVNIKQLANDTSETSHSSIERTRNLVENLEALQRLMKQFQAT